MKFINRVLGNSHKTKTDSLFKMSFIEAIDGYKTDHRRQYPEGTEFVYSNLTPRNGRDPLDTGVIAAGAQASIFRIQELADDTFFSRPVEEVVAEFNATMLKYLGPNTIGDSHIRALHAVGYLPLEFHAIEEGTFVPYGVPMLTVENTLPEFFWLVNYIETLLSSLIWQATTSATTAFKYRVLLEDWAEATGSPVEGIDFQAHDFSFRGQTSPESAMMSGLGHLTSFMGTDTVPAIGFVEHYYPGNTRPVGLSVPATEHSVSCASMSLPMGFVARPGETTAEGHFDEFEFFNRLMDLYQGGIFSAVSDSFDFWHVVTNVLPRLKDRIMGRDGKFVVRPDSGDPVLIICGDPEAPQGTPEFRGAVECLWETFGGTITSTGHRLLDSHIGLIYGDSITLPRADEICRRLSANNFASGNVVFGIGSYTYQYVTRDNNGFAIKATWAEINGNEHLIYKEPKTGGAFSKKSAKGRLAVHRINGVLTLEDGLSLEEWVEGLGDSELQQVWMDSTPLKELTFDEIRANVTREVALARAS